MHLPEIARIQFRHLLETPPDLLVEVDEADQFLWAVKGKYQATAGIGFLAIGESAFGAGRLISKWEGDFPIRERFRQTNRVFGGLLGDTHEPETFGFCFDATDRFRVRVEQVVGESRFERKFTHGNTEPSGDVHLRIVLHDPTGLFKLPVDLLSSFLFGRHATLSTYDGLECLFASIWNSLNIISFCNSCQLDGGRNCIGDWEYPAFCEMDPKSK